MELFFLLVTNLSTSFIFWCLKHETFQKITCFRSSAAIQ